MTMRGIGIGSILTVYVLSSGRRGAEDVCITADWMQSTFGTRDLTLQTRYVGDTEFRVLAARNVRSTDPASVIGDEIRGTVVIIGYDAVNHRLRSLGDDEVRTVEWATSMYRWNDTMIVATEMYRAPDGRCPFEVGL